MRWFRIGLGLSLLWSGLALAASVSADDSGDVKRVRFGVDRNEIRLVLELNKSFKGRVVVPADFKTSKMKIGFSDVQSGALLSGHFIGHLKHWQMQSRFGGSDLVLEFDHPYEIHRRFLLPPDDGLTVYRYVIDFRPSLPDIKSDSDALSPEDRDIQAVDVQDSTASSMASRKVIVIDPGHGGKDPGALGTKGFEKDINLAVAKDLRTILQKTGRYQVVLTRNDDIFIPLEQRMQIARREHADLFISLHADSVSDPNMHGATVYTLSERGVDRAARKVLTHSAMKRGDENGDWFTQISHSSRDASVNRILLDLTQRETTNQSSGFANILISRLNGQVDLLRHSHRDANFVVLLAPDVPAVLLEMGFVTNDVDCARLTSPQGRNQLTRAVADSIDSYFTRATRLALR